MKNLIRQTSFLTLSNVLTRGAGIVFFIILARSLSVSDYGLFRYLLSLSMIYAIFFTGFPTALTKFISGEKADSGAVAEYTTSTVLLMAGVLIVLIIPALIFHEDSFFLILLLFAALVDAVYLGFARGLLNYTKLAGFKLIENAIQLAILIVSYLMYGKVTFAFAIIFFSFSGIASLVIFEIFKPEFKLNFAFSWLRARQLITFTIPVVLGAVGWIVMSGINPILIKHFKGAEQVGFYSVGMTLAQVFSFLPDAIATITMPKVAASKNRQALPRYLVLSAIGILLISAIMLILLLTLKTWILTLLFTNKYTPALVVILPLSIAQILSGIGSIYASAWQGLNKPVVPSVIVSIGAAINLIAGYFLTKQYGIVGASISLLIATAVSFLIIFIFSLDIGLESKKPREISPDGATAA